MISFSFLSKPDFFNQDFKRCINKLVKCIFEQHSDFLLAKSYRVHYHFTNDEHLLQLNLQSLNHDYYTDILTFDYSTPDKIEIEIFISLDRVFENAQSFNIQFMDELIRVMVHGILHCIGYDDHTDEDVLKMRDAEDKYIHFFSSIYVPRGTMNT